MRPSLRTTVRRLVDDGSVVFQRLGLPSDVWGMLHAQSIVSQGDVRNGTRGSAELKSRVRGFEPDGRISRPGGYAPAFSICGRQYAGPDALNVDVYVTKDPFTVQLEGLGFTGLPAYLGRVKWQLGELSPDGQWACSGKTTRLDQSGLGSVEFKGLQKRFGQAGVGLFQAQLSRAGVEIASTGTTDPSPSLLIVWVDTL